MHQSWTVPALLAVVIATSGCFGFGLNGDTATDDCVDGEMTYWLQADGSLAPEAPAMQSAVAGNGFAEAFLTNDLIEWKSEPLASGLLLEGNVSLVYWAQNVGTPAPIVLGGEPGTGYHFFNQFGSNVTFDPSYVVAYRSVAPAPGSIDAYNQTFTLSPGGFRIESREQIRLLLTSLTLDGPDGTGHDILVGGETPSHLMFTATCMPPTAYAPLASEFHDIDLPGNHGLLTGLVPDQDGLNSYTVWFDVQDAAARVTVSIRDTGDARPAKQDIDLTLMDANGADVWGMGSPYTDETGRLWRANLDVLGGPGRYGVRVDSYSGVGYTGELTITQDAFA